MCIRDRTYTEVDLNGIADLNSMNESEAENRLARAGFMVTETSFNYLFACILASMATGLPEEFFTGLPLREVLKPVSYTHLDVYKRQGGDRANDRRQL